MFEAEKAVLKYAWEHWYLKCLLPFPLSFDINQHLFVLGADEVEHKAPVHERQQVIQEECQTAV